MNISESKENVVASRPRVLVTTSWDDDAASGMRVAELLGERKMQGTFYVPTGELKGGSRFTVGNLRTLSENGFEIGAHTVSHRVLTELGEAEMAEEVGGCKSMLEQMLGGEVVMFCYPRGRFNAKIIREVRRAGYGGARTTRMLCSDVVFPPLEMPSTLQAYPHTRSNYFRNVARLGGLSALARSMPEMICFENWVKLAKNLFDQVLRNGGVWHLYGHAWELEKLNLWAQVEEVLDYVSGRDAVAYVTNAQVLQRIKAHDEAGSAQIAGKREATLAH